MSKKTAARILFCLALLCVIAGIAYLKSPSLTRSMTEEYGGVYVASLREPIGFHRLIESVIGDCGRFEMASTVCINNDNLTDADIGLMEVSSALTDVCLSSSSLTDVCVDRLAIQDSLSYLVIASDGVTDNAMAAFSRMSMLTELSLVSNSITGKTISDLATTRIRLLSISSTSLDHSAIAHSSFPETLKLLAVAGVPLSQKQYDAYVANLPEGCRLVVFPLPRTFSGDDANHMAIDGDPSKWFYTKTTACECRMIP